MLLYTTKLCKYRTSACNRLLPRQWASFKIGVGRLTPSLKVPLWRQREINEREARQPALISKARPADGLVPAHEA